MGEGALGRASARPLLRSALRSRWAYRVADRGDLAEVNRAAQELVGDGTIASSVGVAPVPRLSAGMLVVVAVVLVLGLVLSLGPAWRAGRLHPARTLRTE